MSKLLEDTDYSDMEDFLPIVNDNDLKMIESVVQWSKSFKYILRERLTEKIESEHVQVVHMIRKIMMLLFDDSILVNYALYDKDKKKPKKNFLDLLVCDVIFNSILAIDGYGDRYVEIKMKLKAYLTQASYRLSRRNVN